MKSTFCQSKDFEIKTINIYDFRKFIKKIKRSKYLNPGKLDLIFRKRASISYLVMFGYLLGYKEIVLLGVDLNNTKYFFEKNPEYYKKKGRETSKNVQRKDNVHRTLDRTWKGTDHAASPEPQGIRKLVRDLIAVQKSMTYKNMDLLEIEKPQREKFKKKK